MKPVPATPNRRRAAAKTPTQGDTPTSRHAPAEATPAMRHLRGRNLLRALNDGMGVSVNGDFTERDLKTLEAANQWMSEHGYPPTAREICTLAGFTSTSVVGWHLSRLRGLGLVEWQRGLARTLCITELGARILAATP